MRSVQLIKKRGKFVIEVNADGYYRQYIEETLINAKNRVERLKLLLSIK